jgi:hypothetical protein
MKTEQVHISRISAGDVIFHDNKERTVCEKDIKRDDFVGITLFGDCYRLGRVLVTRVLYTRVLPT